MRGYINTHWLGICSLYLTGISYHSYYKITALCCGNKYAPTQLHKAYLGNQSIIPQTEDFLVKF